MVTMWVWLLISIFCLSSCFRIVVFSWMTRRATAVIPLKVTCSAMDATSSDSSHRLLPTRLPATPSMSLNCEGEDQAPPPRWYQQCSKTEGLHPFQQFKESLYVAIWATAPVLSWTAFCGLRLTVQLPPRALLSHGMAGIKGPLLFFHLWFPPSPFPLGA